MSALIKRLVVRGLHGRVDIDVPFESDISIFMGPNGIGKSTILNILVHFLTQQWDKLGKQPFETVCVTFSSGIEVSVSHADCLDFSSGEMSPRTAEIASKLSESGLLEPFLEGRGLEEVEATRLESQTGLQQRELRLFRASIANLGPSLKAASVLWAAGREIAANFSHKILYLPTFRRVEQDLSEVLAMSSMTMRRVRAEIEAGVPSSPSLHTELVKFGMEDIDRLIKGYSLQIREYSRQQINSLSVSYLTAALKPRQNFNRDFFEGLTDKKISDILARVDDEQLNGGQRKGITDLIKSLRHRLGGGRLTRSQEHISGYFPMLADTHERISSRERPLQQLAEVLNRYVGPTKRASYDATRYEFSISVDSKEIPLGGLSSGEKQVVSLFATLALSSEKNLLVIVDEPELSLSVLWQEILLSDMMSMHSCSGVIAVTHSPFIYGDHLISYTKDLGDYTKGRIF